MSQSYQSFIDAAERQNRLSTFVTELGWFGFVGCETGEHDRCVSALTFGHRTPGEVHEHLHANGAISRLTTPTDWWPELRERLQAYSAGACDDFSDIAVVDSRSTAFQQRVVAELREVGYGQTLSYGQLAVRAGSPLAARAVGHVMSTNPVPIVIPCHRVLASGGRLGGYSAPSGLNMKRRLLDLEACGASVPC